MWARSYHWLEGQHDRLPALLADLLDRHILAFDVAALVEAFASALAG